MKKIILALIIALFTYTTNAQVCSEVKKAMRKLTYSDIDAAEKLFNSVGELIEASSSKNETIEPKCLAKYYYGAGSTALQVFLNNRSKDLEERNKLLNKSEKFLNQFFELGYEDKDLNIRANTDLQAVANHQTSLGVDYFYKEQNYSKALELFEKAIENKSKLKNEPIDLHVYEAAMIAATKNEDYEKALKYNDVLIRNPQLKIGSKVNNQEINLLKKASLLDKLGETQKAIQVLDSASKVFPESIGILRKQLEIYVNQQNDDKSLEVAENIEQTVKNDERLYIIIGNIYSKKGMIDSSYAAYKSALALNPKSPHATYGLASYYIMKSNQVVQQKQEGSAPENAEELRSKNLNKGIHFLKAYLELEPKDKPALETLKKIYSSLGEEEKAQEIQKRLEGL